MIAEIAALALTCAPNIHPVTLHALIRHESRVQQYAIGVNRKGQHLRRQPQTLAEATTVADRLIDQGIDFDAGLGQINVRNWAWLNLDSKTVFDPCRNLAAAQTVLAECYARALPRQTDPQHALRAALSCYNTGNFKRGFTNGYVGKVLAQAKIKVPALAPLKNETAEPATKATPAEPAQKPDQGPPAPPEGAPDGFSANPATDGFSQTRDDEPESSANSDT
ncbi:MULTISPECIES: lytic transglycosylase domain-containing protein [Alcaligenaceae]|uniref:lytic transglycosylase domain-containing protein n=1 Tax=Alcaligenaceae TaxID=506 RepID=UPI0010219291|nr:MULTISPECIES: lytic transglycosylase domain-containing protein [Alcaligenaceae]MCC2597317.1 lytic transglycosylase domain-containing protein [Pusillimonas sp. MFBS29]TEA79219.1 type VI secretion protein [Allopusillimonas ginsengisoli]TKR55509.1 lytic transglycosylase domain-containing protein [Allopusillimonas ginsengisoli]